MVKSLRLSGKFNPEEAEIIKKFQKDPIVDPELEVDTRFFSKYEEKLSDNQLVRWAIFSLIINRQGNELMHLLELKVPKSDIDKWEKNSAKQTNDLLKKKKSGRPKTKKKRGRPEDKGR